jgi:hypothetical protein
LFDGVPLINQWFFLFLNNDNESLHQNPYSTHDRGYIVFLLVYVFFAN